MKKQFLLFLFAIFQISVYAQPSIQWQMCLGGTGSDDAWSIEQTSDGGYIMTGVTTSNDGDVSGNHGGIDSWIVKQDSLGVIQWQKCLGGTSNEEARSIRQTMDGGYILTGYTYSNDGDVVGNHGWADILVVQLSSLGIIQWQKCLGGTGNEDAYSIQQTSDGGYVLLGQTTSNDGDVSGLHGIVDDIWVVKLSSLGIIQWQKCIGGSAYDYASSIQQTSDGGYILTGYTQSNNGDVSGNHGSSPNVDAWVVKLSSLGMLQWQKCLGGTSDDNGYSVQQTNDGGYVLAGSTTSNDGDVNGNHGNEDVWVVKLSSLGIIQWQKCLGGTSGDAGYSIKQINDGGYVIAGQTYSNNGDVSGYHGSGDTWVVKLNSSGIIQWQNCLGGTMTERSLSFQETNDLGYILAGYTNSNNGDVSGNHGSADFWVVKLSSTVAVNELSSIASLNVFPNPVSDNLIVTFSLLKTENITLQLKDVIGQNLIEPIYLKNMTGTYSHSISLSEFPSGIYLMDIIGEEGRSTKKIVVDHN